MKPQGSPKTRIGRGSPKMKHTPPPKKVTVTEPKSVLKPTVVRDITDVTEDTSENNDEFEDTQEQVLQEKPTGAKPKVRPSTFTQDSQESEPEEEQTPHEEDYFDTDELRDKVSQLCDIFNNFERNQNKFPQNQCFQRREGFKPQFRFNPPTRP